MAKMNMPHSLRIKSKFHNRRLKLHFLERLRPNIKLIFVVNGALQMHAMLELVVI